MAALKRDTLIFTVNHTRHSSLCEGQRLGQTLKPSFSPSGKEVNVRRPREVCEHPQSIITGRVMKGQRGNDEL